MNFPDSITSASAKCGSVKSIVEVQLHIPSSTQYSTSFIYSNLSSSISLIDCRPVRPCQYHKILAQQSHTAEARQPQERVLILTKFTLYKITCWLSLQYAFYSAFATIEEYSTAERCRSARRRSKNATATMAAASAHTHASTIGSHTYVGGTLFLRKRENKCEQGWIKLWVTIVCCVLCICIKCVYC